MPIQGLNYQPIKPSDLDGKADPSLGVLNQQFHLLFETVNRLMGARGAIQLNADLNLGGNRITNLGAAQEETDALSQTSAEPLYGISVQQKNMEAVGNNMLQTTRRLNDGSQQHKISTDLNLQGSIPPSNITGTLSFAPGANSVAWTWLNIIIQLADKSFVAIKNSSLNVTGLAGSTSYFFYPYYDSVTGLLVFVADNVNGVGIPPVAFASANTDAGQTQNTDGHIALTATGVTVTTGGAGGNATLRTR